MLEQSAHRLYIANHMDSKAERRVHDVQRKTDANDADLLSLLCISHAHPTKAATRKRALWPWETIKPTTGPRDEVHWYQALIAERTKTKNRLSAEPDPLHGADLEQQLALLQRQIEATRARMTATAGEEERLLATIPGISLRRACVMTAAIDTVRRFPTPDKLVGYLAMKPPWRDQTGGRETGKVHIPKGLTLLHSELFMAALAIACVKRDCSLTRTWHRIKERSGGRAALLAVRRQIIRTAWGVLMTGQPYRDTRALKSRIVSETDGCVTGEAQAAGG